MVIANDASPDQGHRRQEAELGVRHVIEIAKIEKGREVKNEKNPGIKFQLDI